MKGLAGRARVPLGFVHDSRGSDLARPREPTRPPVVWYCLSDLRLGKETCRVWESRATPPTLHMPFFASCSASEFSLCGTPCIEMHGSEYSDAAGCEFGVRVAPIHGVSAANTKTAGSSRKGGIGSCYNRRRINDLGTGAERAKIAQFSHRHGLGDNVKGIVPARLWSQMGTRGTNAPKKTASNLAERAWHRRGITGTT